MSLRPLFLASCFWLIALTTPAPAQEKPAQVGETVSPKTSAVDWYEKRDGHMERAGTLDALTTTVVALAPDYYLVRWRGRQGWVKRDDVVLHSEGLTHFRGCVEHDASDGYARCMYAFNLMGDHQYDSARLAADEAIRLLPNDSRPLMVRIALFCLQGNWKDALDDLSVAVRLDPTNSDLYVSRAAVVGMGQRQYEKALPDFDKAIRLSPNQETIYTTRAQVWCLKGDFAKAAADLDKAVQVAPDFVSGHVARAVVRSMCQDPAVIDLKEAGISARRACELTHWEDAANLRQLATICGMAGNKDEARRWQEKADQLERANVGKLPPLPSASPATPAPALAPPEEKLPTEPDRKDSLVGKELSPKTATVFWYENRDGKAVRGGTFNNPVGTIVGVAPGFYLVHWRGREGWVKRDDVVLGDERFVYFTERARLNPSDVYAQRMCAQNCISATYYDAAFQYIEAAVRLAPDDIAVLQTRAILRAVVKHDKAGALEDFAAAERLDPSDPLTFAMRATLLWQPLREYDKAEADFDKAIRLTPTDESFYFWRATYWLSRGEYARALADLDTCIRLWPEDLLAHIGRAELLMDCPDRIVANPKEAVVSARRICELTRWENTTHLRRLARICEVAGDHDEAMRWRKKAEEIERSNATHLPPLPPAQP